MTENIVRSRPLLAHRLTHLELLVMLIATITIQSFLDGETLFERIILNLSLFAIVLSAIRSLSKSKIKIRVSIGLGIVALIASMLTELDPADPLLDTVYFCYLTVFVILLVALSESVFTLGPTSTDRIIGSVTIYLVMALAWAFVYALMEIHWPNSFKLNVIEREGIHSTLVNELFYFSTVTLTTLGYGDIVPISRPARMMASIEAIAGQLYVAVVIAHLVGTRISQGSGLARADENGDQLDENDEPD